MNHTTSVTTGDLHDQIGGAMTDISKILVRSYGPLGGSAILSNGGMRDPIITKDGKTILDALKFMETPLKQDVLLHIRSIAKKLVNEVGDGSTSSVLVATELFKSLQGIRGKYTNGKFFEQDLRVVHTHIEEIIERYLSRPLPQDREARIAILADLASVSNNNDKVLGRTIAEIMNDHANEFTVVNITKAAVDSDERITFTAKSGFDAAHAKISNPQFFGLFPKDTDIALERPIIVTVKDLLQVHYNHIITATKDLQRPVFIFAESVQKEVEIAYVRDSMAAVGHKHFPLTTIFNANPTTNSELAYRKHIDFEMYVGSNANRLEASVTESPDSYVPDDGRWYLGGAEKIIINKHSGTATIINGDGINGPEGKVELCQDYLETLKSELAKLSADLRIQRGMYQGSINRILGQSLTIYVGGHTDEEKVTTKALVEDSVLACQSAMKGGYTVGANQSTLFALKVFGNTAINNGIEGVTLKHTDIALKMIEAYERVRDIPFGSQGLDVALKPDYKKWDGVGVLTVDLKKPVTKNSNSLSPCVILNTNNMQTEVFEPNGTSVSVSLPKTTIFAATNTDKAILNASLSIVTLLLNSNQYLSN